MEVVVRAVGLLFHEVRKQHGIGILDENNLGGVSVSDAGGLGRQDNKVDWRVKQIMKKGW